MEQQIEEIAEAMQKSYQADIDFLERRDKAHVAKLAALEAELATLRAQAEQLKRIADLIERHVNTLGVTAEVYEAANNWINRHDEEESELVQERRRAYERMQGLRRGMGLEE